MKVFDDVLGLIGLIVMKFDGIVKGGIFVVIVW